MTGRISTSGRSRQQGVTLIIALVMLVVIGLASAALMRSALNSGQVANNTRVQTLASQAAQIGLRYCETQIQLPAAARDAGFKLLDNVDPKAWTDFNNWFGEDKVAVTVPATSMSSEDSSFAPAVLPQCIAEWDTSVGGTTGIIVTARGFSPDYSESDTGLQTAGSVVWLQSFNRMK